MSISSPETDAALEELSTLAARVHQLTEVLVAAGTADGAEVNAVQQLLTDGVRLYVAKRSADEVLSPFLENTITATDVSITTTGMLDAVDLQLFELTLWQGWGRP
jgi:hypothetical protein